MKEQKMVQFKMGELFCGPGGIAYGAVTAQAKNPDYRIVHQWATDYDRDTCDTYAHNICPEALDSVIHEDIRKLNLQGLKPIDALAFGFPCNDYSVVGEQKGAKFQLGLTAGRDRLF
jgi:DNA (cytosine-5)-methyltransferase 1